MLDDVKVHTKIKLAALWASVMFCYIYADYFGLFSPGQLATMNQGQIPPLGRSTDGVMIFVSAMMAVPSLMIFLSVALPAAASRILNIVAGAAYTAIISITIFQWKEMFSAYWSGVDETNSMPVTVFSSFWSPSRSMCGRQS